MYQHFAEELKKAESASSVLIDEPMNRHTTFRIGGPADVFCIYCLFRNIVDVGDLYIGYASPILIGDHFTHFHQLLLKKEMDPMLIEEEAVLRQSLPFRPKNPLQSKARLCSLE